MMPCSPAMTFCSIVGHARRQTAERRGPSVIERSNDFRGDEGPAIRDRIRKGVYYTPLDAQTEPSPPSKRIKELEGMVADAIVETSDTTTLVLFTGNDRLDYSAGHFLTIDPHQFEALDRFTAFLEHLKGRKEPPRAYSMCSAPHEKYLAVTVKEERFVPGTTKYPPLLSPLLVKRTVRGMGLVVTGFPGPTTR